MIENDSPHASLLYALAIAGTALFEELFRESCAAS